MPARLKRWLGLAFGLLGILFIVWLDARSGFHSHHPLSQVNYALALMIGFMTSFHCVGMCGALVLSYTTQDAALGRPRYLSHFWYGLGKTLSYTAIGAAFAALGGIVAFTPGLRGAIAIAAGIFLVLFGLNLLGIVRLRVQLRTPPALMRFIGRQYKKRSHPFVIGLLNGLMIVCGPLQAMYILAAGTSDPRQGAALLFCFGIGTLPVMLGFGVFASTLSKSVGPVLVKFSSVVVILMGAVMLNRGLILTRSDYDIASLIARAETWVSRMRSPVKPLRIVRMQVTAEDFEPDHFVLQVGVPVRWEIQVAENAFCRSELEVPSFGLKIALTPGLHAVEFAPPRTGLILWRCTEPQRWGAFTVQ
ncbi:conserved hypothetical protein [Methylomarinovum tepidoasis]|uniref:Urease accessory protein UreH-like transmembrane domain-containing protein n=1 Tax=Methylomarinovum tepidoasis TaxID=2840183 RepID=A0AAU9CCF3_9GAMM|nr:sulfite exporter TauE/SafE family protein [Methylomarinovum sp. IN45]BCX88441.1 conserved hypothetical protein [Methylomarinovum sp. IN45]